MPKFKALSEYDEPRRTTIDYTASSWRVTLIALCGDFLVHFGHIKLFGLRNDGHRYAATHYLRSSPPRDPNTSSFTRAVPLDVKRQPRRRERVPKGRLSCWFWLQSGEKGYRPLLAL